MAIQINLNPGLESRLMHQARENGMTPGDYAQKLLERAIASTGNAGARASQQAFGEFLDSVARDAPSAPHLHSETFSRATIYGEHD